MGCSGTRIGEESSDSYVDEETGEIVSDDSGECTECGKTGSAGKNWAETKYS